jgi:3-dehydroquinate dehydratase/shikimate dehydrogenase
MAKICLCLTAKTLKRNLEILNKYRKYTDMAELRVDCLEPDERLLIRRFPEKAGIPVILAIRRDIDGGYFDSGEGSRVNLMARGLAYAEVDRRRNFAYLDIEHDLSVPSLEEAARTFGTKIIRSYHDIKGSCKDLSEKIRTMRHSDDEIIKLSVTVNTTKDVLRLLKAGKENPEQDKILIAAGYYGIYSRILAEHFGSILSYVSPLSEPDILQAAFGHIDVQEMAQLYQFRHITNNTKVYGVAGFPLKVTDSPYFFNTVFRLEEIDAVYVPFPSDSISAFMELAQELNVAGLSITIPYKETVIPFLNYTNTQMRKINACNTIIRGNVPAAETPNRKPASPKMYSSHQTGWLGANTDAKGFSDSLLAFLARPHLKRQCVTVIGAGGAARAVVYELYRLGAKVLILNRGIQKAYNLAAPYNFKWGGLDSHGIKMMNRYCDIIIQTTPAGMEGYDCSDPAEMYKFNGQEAVMDLIYKPEKTPFLERAAEAGCQIQNGYDMFIRQACYQYALFTGEEFSEYLMTRIQSAEHESWSFNGTTN